MFLRLTFTKKKCILAVYCISGDGDEALVDFSVGGMRTLILHGNMLLVYMCIKLKFRVNLQRGMHFLSILNTVGKLI